MKTVYNMRNKQPVACEGKPLGQGGEAACFRTHCGRVAKLYHKPDERQRQKLEAMLLHSPRENGGHPSFAWPQELLADKRGRFLGYVMPAVETGLPLYRLCVPKNRNDIAPGCDFRFLLTVAQNFAACIEKLHRHGCVVGDIKPMNALVTKNARVTLIDIDSVQFTDPVSGRIFPCPVASEGFTPPEVLGRRDMSTVHRMIEHDLFGLAAVIFFLLHGAHPFSGQWNGSGEPPTTDMNIKCGRWTYGDDGDLSPSLHALPMDILHPELQSLFHRCFSDGMHSPRSRPSCREWIEALHRATTQLKPCDKVSTHCYDATQNRDCPFCAYRKRTGYELFNAHRQKNKTRKKRPQRPAPKNPSSSSSSVRMPFLGRLPQTFINNGTDWQARLKTPSLPRPPGQFSRLGKHPMHGFLWQPSSSKQPMTDYMQYLSDLLKNL